MFFRFFKKNRVKIISIYSIDIMLSLKNGKPIAIIKGGMYHNTIIHIDTEKKAPDVEQSYFDNTTRDLSKIEGQKEFYIYDEGTLEPLPDFNETQRIYISGSTGCGKSYYIRKWLKQYIKVFPNRKIYLFSDMLQDPALDDFKNLERFVIYESLLKKKTHKA